jgi:hypothetical protein
MAASDTAAFHAPAEKCPFRSYSVARPSTTTLATPEPAALGALFVAHRLSLITVNAAPQSVVSETFDTRGPPRFALA